VTKKVDRFITATAWFQAIKVICTKKESPRAGLLCVPIMFDIWAILFKLFCSEKRRQKSKVKTAKSCFRGNALQYSPPIVCFS